MNYEKYLLKNLLLLKSFKYSNEPEFELNSGKMSQVYIDCKMITLSSQGLNLIGGIIYNIVRPLGINGIGGLTLGADPIAVATTMFAGQEDERMSAFVIRKESKKYGTKKYIEGNVQTGDKVVIVDDVITTGASTIEAIDKAEQFGLHIVKVIAFIDREEGGKENICDRGYNIQSVFTKTNLLNEYLEIHRIK